MKSHAMATRLKARARGQLLGKYMPLSAAFFTLTMLHYLISVPAGVLSLPWPFSLVLYYTLDFALGLLFSVFEVGLAYLFLSNACGQPVTSFGLFSGFGQGPQKAISIWLVPSLFLLVPTLLPDLLMTQCILNKDFKWALYAFGATLLFLPLTLFIKILYSQVFYIMLDFPEMTASECRRYSVRLMQGNKGRYLYLLLSFLPLYLLGVLSLGIGLLYVAPYRAQTCADFYLELIGDHKTADKPL